MKKRILCPKPAVPGVDQGCWVNMDAVNYIREHIANFKYPLGVFHTLNIIMSDQKSRTFQVTCDYIGYLAGGLSRREVIRCLDSLQRIGVIKVDSSKGRRIPATITMLGEVRYE